MKECDEKAVKRLQFDCANLASNILKAIVFIYIYQKYIIDTESKIWRENAVIEIKGEYKIILISMARDKIGIAHFVMTFDAVCYGGIDSRSDSFQNHLRFNLNLYCIHGDTL